MRTDRLRRQTTELPTDWPGFARLLIFTQKLLLETVTDFKLHSIDGIKCGLPLKGVGPKILIFHTSRESVLILREKDLDL